MTASCGLDFGTSNSTLGLDRGTADRLLPLEDGRFTLPSAVFFHVEEELVSYGRAALADYLAGYEGRLMRSLKSLLGTSTMEEQTELLGRSLSFRELLGSFIGELKRRGEAAAGTSFQQAVVGRPVHFVDQDEAADRLAEDTLREIALASGFREISFEFEPIAAAFDHESRLASEELVLVVDIGGGTSDFSLVRLGPQRAARADRRSDILGNGGIHIGGTDLDRVLSLAAAMPSFGYRSRLRDGREMPATAYFNLATWHLINKLYTRKSWANLQELRRDAADRAAVDRLLELVRHRDGHWLAMQVEETKIALSAETQAALHLARNAEGDSPITIDRPTLDAAIAPLVARIEQSIVETLGDAGVKPGDVDTIFYTGGSSSVALLRERVASVLPLARRVEGDLFGSIGAGLAIAARRRYGC